MSTNDKESSSILCLVVGIDNFRRWRWLLLLLLLHLLLVDTDNNNNLIRRNLLTQFWFDICRQNFFFSQPRIDVVKALNEIGWHAAVLLAETALPRVAVLGEFERRVVEVGPDRFSALLRVGGDRRVEPGHVTWAVQTEEKNNVNFYLNPFISFPFLFFDWVVFYERLVVSLVLMLRKFCLQQPCKKVGCHTGSREKLKPLTWRMHLNLIKILCTP